MHRFDLRPELRLTRTEKPKRITWCNSVYHSITLEGRKRLCNIEKNSAGGQCSGAAALDEWLLKAER